MKFKRDNVLLFIHPETKATPEPVLDEYTLKMGHALEHYKERDVVVNANGNGEILKGIRTMGYHHCICGAYSESADYGVECQNSDILYTNSLACHYLAYHREDVDNDDLEKVNRLPEPPKDYTVPKYMLTNRIDSLDNLNISINTC